jgi:hypothetical protein
MKPSTESVAQIALERVQTQPTRPMTLLEVTLRKDVLGSTLSAARLVQRLGVHFTMILRFVRGSQVYLQALLRTV